MCQLRVLQRMQKALTLKPLRRRKEKMKSLDTILATISWIVLAIVLWALAPLLMKLISIADGLNHFFSK